jgi:hypothetical protein
LLLTAFRLLPSAFSSFAFRLALLLKLLYIHAGAEKRTRLAVSPDS